MADFYATSRSNYVLVKDVTAAIESLKDFDIPIHRHPTNENAIMLAGCPYFGTFNSSYVDENTGEDTYLNLAEWASTHLVEGQVLVLVSAGAEKLRYVSAWAEAYTWKGEVIHVDLLDALFRKIYEKLDLGEIEVADPSYTNLYEG
jgi:hypothetical protein